MNTYALLADVILVVHAAFIGFVVVGLLLVVAGMAARWRWVRNFWFRTLHLAAIAIVVAQSWAGVICPLTTFEGYLRHAAGQTLYAEGFVAHWLHKIIFFQAEPWIFVLAYTLFGALVIGTWIVCFPRRPWQASRRAA